MAQRGKAGKSLIQVGRDYIRSFLNINISNQRSTPSSLSLVCRWIYDFFHKQKQIEELKTQLEKKKAKVRWLEEKLAERKEEIEGVCDKLEKLTSRGLAKDKNNEDLLEIARLLARLSKERHESEAYENAGRWMHSRLGSLVEEATNFVIQNSPEDIHEDIAKDFRADLFAYREWFEESMEYARPLRADLENLNSRRCIRYPHPYRQVIDRVRSEILSHDLEQEEYIAIETMFRFLYKNL